MDFIVESGPWALVIFVFALASGGIALVQFTVKKFALMPLSLGLCAAAVWSGLAGVLGGVTSMRGAMMVPPDMKATLIAQGVSQVFGNATLLALVGLPLTFVLAAAAAVHAFRLQKSRLQTEVN